MKDITPALAPKCDELTGDDLIAGPRTIRVTGVDLRLGQERPVLIWFEGDEGRPFKPCKTVSRLIAYAWGPDMNKYVGKSMTVYRDAKVTWGGLEVGGVRISHLSDIERDMVVVLNAKKGKKLPHTVKPLKQQRNSSANQPSEAPSPEAGMPSVEPEAADGAPAETLYDNRTGGEEVPSPASQALAFEDALKAAATEADLAETWKSNVDLVRQLKADEPALFAAVNKAKDDRKAALAAAVDDIGY